MPGLYGALGSIASFARSCPCACSYATLQLLSCLRRNPQALWVEPRRAGFARSRLRGGVRAAWLRESGSFEPRARDMLETIHQKIASIQGPARCGEQVAVRRARAGPGHGAKSALIRRVPDAPLVCLRHAYACGPRR